MLETWACLFPTESKHIVGSSEPSASAQGPQRAKRGARQLEKDVGFRLGPDTTVIEKQHAAIEAKLRQPSALATLTALEVQDGKKDAPVLMEVQVRALHLLTGASRHMHNPMIPRPTREVDGTGPRDKVVQQRQRFISAQHICGAMKHPTVGGLDTPACHTRRRPSQAGWIERRPLCLQPVHLVPDWRTRKQP